MFSVRFISIKWQIVAITAVMSAGILLAMISYWKISLNRATELSRIEDNKTATLLIDSIYPLWRQQMMTAVDVIALDERVQNLLGGEHPDTHKAEILLDALSITSEAVYVQMDSYVNQISVNYKFSNFPDIPSISSAPVNVPVTEIICTKDLECMQIISVPILHHGKTVGRAAAAFSLKGLFSNIKRSRIPANIAIIKREQKTPVGWKIIQTESLQLPNGYQLAGLASPQGHLKIIRFALQAAGALGSIAFILMQLAITVLLFRTLSYVKILLSGFQMLQRGDTSALRTHLIRKKRWRFINDELDVIGEVMLKTSVELVKLKELDARSTEDRVRLTATQYIAEERRQLLSKFASREEDLRQNLARELHDEMGARLVSIRVDAAMIKNTEDVPEDIRTRALRIEQNCLNLAKFLSAAIETLCPPVIESLGLSAGIKGIVEEWSSRLKGKTHFNVSIKGDLETLPSPQATATYRIVQEAITNIAKHADAGNVNVEIVRKPTLSADDSIYIDILDDGKGFDRQEFDPEQIKRGIQGMEDRAKGFGGSFVIISVPGNGTRIRCTLPVYPNGDTLDEFGKLLD